MKTALYYAPENIKIEEREMKRPEKGEILVKNKIALTCGTDVKMYKRGYPLFEPPFSFGHEASGVVVEVGEGVSHFKVGDRVVAHNTAPCQTCFYCKKGQHSMCEDLLFNLGAFSEYQIIPEKIVAQNTFHIPETLSFKDAALLEPFACAVYGIDEANIQLGDTVCINGAGPIGLMLLKLAVLQGASVIVCDLSDERLQIAKKLGASHTINVSRTSDQVQAVINMTEHKRGVDVAIEAVGVPVLWEKTVLMARKGGTVLLFGGPKGGTTITLDTKLMHYSQLTIKGVFHTTPKHVSAAFHLLKNGVIKADDFIYDEYPLDDLEQAILSHQSGKVIKNAIAF